MYKKIIFVLLLSLSLGCTINTVIDPYLLVSPERDLIKVGYYIPRYAEPGSGILSVDLQDPIPLETTGKIIHYKDYIFINKPLEGIHILNNEDPKNPVNQGFIQVKGSLDMAIINDFLYVDQFSAMVVLDITNMNTITLVEDYTVNPIFNYDYYWAFDPEEDKDAYAYYRFDPIDDKKGIVVGWDLEIRWEKDYIYSIYREDTVENMVALEDQTPKSQAGSLARFLPVDNFLYALNEWELILFEIEENNKPLRFGKTPTNSSAETLFRLNELLFVGTTTGMLVYGIEDIKNPEFFSRVDHFRSCDPVVADQNFAYVTLRGGTNCFTDQNELQIISLEDPKNLEVVSKQILFNPHGLAVHENHLIVCDGAAGIKVMDIEDRTAPTIVNTYPVDFAYDVIVDYPLAVVVGDGKVYQYDMSQLPALTLISE